MKDKSDIILGMIMLEDNTGFNIAGFTQDYDDNYNYAVKYQEGGIEGFVCAIEGENIAIMQMGFPIPDEDIKGTGQYAYNWPTVLDDIKDHKDHLIISVMTGSYDPVKRFRIFTQVICSLLRTTKAIGVYKGNQSLLIPKDSYLQEAGKISDDNLPINLWIYFGLRKTNSGNSGYTYGLTLFNKTELEIIDSSKSLIDIRLFLLNIAHYVLYFDVTFKAGQTCGLSEEEKISITYKKGHFVEGNSFKLGY